VIQYGYHSDKYEISNPEPPDYLLDTLLRSQRVYNFAPEVSAKCSPNQDTAW